jgi:hypothetical protein
MSVAQSRPAPDAAPSDDTFGAAVIEARSLPAHEAANLLHISPATLRAWEQGFGFPVSVGCEHAVPEYLVTELLALQEALSEALSITAAIHAARQHTAHTC